MRPGRRKRSVPASARGAVRWFGMAPEQGDADAQLYLGVMYFDVEGVLADPVLARMWYNIAAATNRTGPRTQGTSGVKDDTGGRQARYGPRLPHGVGLRGMRIMSDIRD